MLFPQSYLYPVFLEGADSVSDQLHGDKECPFSGVSINSGRVWRKVLESDAWSMMHEHIHAHLQILTLFFDNKSLACKYRNKRLFQNTHACTLEVILFNNDNG